MSNGTIRRILSIDGGGIKGVFPASFLKTIEEELPRPIGEYFDLIVGTSTGGIIAIGLGLGFSANDLLDFYLKLGPDVFAGNRILKLFRSIGIAKYNPEPLYDKLVEKFGDRKIGESKTRLVIPSMNLNTLTVHIYKTSHHVRLMKDYKRPVVEAAMATAAAPTFFPSYKSAQGIPFIDGGLWANNPMAVAAVEALTILGWEAKDVRMLSLGCTQIPPSIHWAQRFSLGLVYWGFKAKDAFMGGQASGALGMAQHLLGKDNVIRINPVVPSGRYSLDSVKELEALCGLGYDQARHNISDLMPIFFTEPAEPFEPSHSL
jgi:uncharacterized protein